jgi:serine/threonine protein kinase
MSFDNRRMIYEIYNTNEIKKILEPSKSMNTFISENAIKVVKNVINNNSKNININKNNKSTNKKGVSSSAAIYKFPNGKLYIVRKTPALLVPGQRIKKELAIYNILLSNPDYKNYISDLVYADAHLAAGKGDSYFIFNYENGDVLSEYIKKNKNVLSFEEVMKIYRHLEKAIDFLESNNVVHRDIKPDNIYFSTDRNIPLLFDFDISCYGSNCLSVEYTGSPEYSTPASKILRGQEGFSVSTRLYRYSSAFDRYSLAVLLEKDLIKLTEDKEAINRIALEEKEKYNTANVILQDKKGGKTNNNTRKRKGGRIGIMNPLWGGKNKPESISEVLLNVSEVFTGGSDKGCSKTLMMNLPEGISLGPLTQGLKGGNKLKKTRKNKLKFEI